MTDSDLRLSAQRALWGAVPTSLRAFSVEAAGNIVRTRSIFDGTETPCQKELLAVATTEIVSDFHDQFTIEDEVLNIPLGTLMQHLQHLIFLRHEP
jgi:hypothetical protein